MDVSFFENVPFYFLEGKGLSNLYILHGERSKVDNSLYHAQYMLLSLPKNINTNTVEP